MHEPRGGLAGLIRRHPLSAFFLWFFTIGQAFVLVPLSLGAESPSQWLINGSTVFGLLLPAVVITRIVDGSEGVRLLGRRVVKVRAPAGLYLVGIVVMPLLAIALAAALLGAPQVPAGTVLTAIGGAILIGTITGLLLNNLWEEVAWMGFVQARLQERHGAMRAALIAAPLFALQHTALFIQNDAVTVVVLLLAFIALVIPFRALMAWLYNRSGGSLFLVGLVHALSNAVGPGAGFSPGYLRRLYPDDAMLVGVLHVVAIALIGLVVIAATRARLGRSEPEGAAEAPGGMRVAGAG